jgi:hypothetical protein
MSMTTAGKPLLFAAGVTTPGSCRVREMAASVCGHEARAMANRQDCARTFSSWQHGWHSLPWSTYARRRDSDAANEKEFLRRRGRVANPRKNDPKSAASASAAPSCTYGMRNSGQRDFFVICADLHTTVSTLPL